MPAEVLEHIVRQVQALNGGYVCMKRWPVAWLDDLENRRVLWVLRGLGTASLAGMALGLIGIVVGVAGRMQSRGDGLTDLANGIAYILGAILFLLSLLLSIGTHLPFRAPDQSSLAKRVGYLAWTLVVLGAAQVLQVVRSHDGTPLADYALVLAGALAWVGVMLLWFNRSRSRPA